MNVYDSQVAAGLLEKAGFEVIQETTDHGSQTTEKKRGSWTVDRGPDIVLMNTCSVRDHAEQRVWGRLGMLGQEKKRNPDLIIGLMGCMVEEHRESLFKRFPQLDLMIGTRNIKELPALIRRVIEKREKVAKIKQDGISIEYSEFTKRDSPYHAWLPIMTGCDKVCTFCIVPKTRGAEVSMPTAEVCREARRLAADGVKWITLLGQNVNSYGVGSPEFCEQLRRTPYSVPRTETDGVSFPRLLEMLCGIEGLERLSFTTSHPSDATEELFQVIAKNPKISRRFHLPLQSGSDRILKRMKRLHTYEEFKAKVERLRELVPDIAITTDIIVGFPGETEKDYQATKHALEEIAFDGAFIYKYSVRPGTPAANLPDDVPLDVKSRRNQELLQVQKAITERKNRQRLGSIAVVFVEAANSKNSKERIGRTDEDKRVYFESEGDEPGRFAKIKLTDLRHETFRGEPVSRSGSSVSL